jgi:hypothetical protein
MNEDGRSQGEVLLRCPRCSSPHDPEDSYCRHCGAALHATRVPIVRDDRSYAPVPWRETVPVVIGGAAVVAAGTLAEAVLRRLIGRALRRLARPPDGQTRLPARRQPEKAQVVEQPQPDHDDAQVVSETFLFRRVRLRRRGWPSD